MERARRASVLAYCARICDPARIAEAADAAFAGLESKLEDAPSYQVVDLDRALLEATREAAAARVGDPTAAAGGRLLSRRSTNTCALMPTLLAARASGRLGAGDRAAMERHVAKCPGCREMAQRRDEAEQAFTALVGAPVEPEASKEPFAPGDPEPEVSVSRSDVAEPEVAAEAADDPGAPTAADLEAGAAGEPEAAEAGKVAEPRADAEPDADGESGADGEPEALAHDDADEPELFTDDDAEDEPDHFANDDGDAEPHRDFTRGERIGLPAAAVASGAAMQSRLYDPPEFDGPTGHTEEFDVQAALDREGNGFGGLDADDPRTTLPTWRDGAPIGGTRTVRHGRRGWLILGLFLAGVVILAVGLLQLAGNDGGGTSDTQGSRQSAAAPAPAAAPATPQLTKAELRRRARLRSLGDRDLSLGTEGADVKALQKLLGVSPTGNFGELTEFALKDFQTEHGLPATGIADDATKRKLARRSKPPSQAPVPSEQQQNGQPGDPGTGTEGQTTPPAGTTQQGQAPQTQTPPAGQAPAGQSSAGQ